MKNYIDFQSGDIFLAQSKTLLDPVINWVQHFWAKDDESVYGHAGLILDEAGNTFDALWSVGSTCFYERYKGCRVLVARYTELTPEKLQTGLSRVLNHDGEWFPIYRLPLAALHIAKFIHWNNVVCSELVAKFLNAIGTRHHHWFGTNVDDLHEELVNYKQYKIVFEGVMEPS
jgi:hypothetical protein